MLVLVFQGSNSKDVIALQKRQSEIIKQLEQLRLKLNEMQSKLALSGGVSAQTKPTASAAAAAVIKPIDVSCWTFFQPFQDCFWKQSKIRSNLTKLTCTHFRRDIFRTLLFMRIQRILRFHCWACKHCGRIDWILWSSVTRTQALKNSHQKLKRSSNGSVNSNRMHRFQHWNYH